MVQSQADMDEEAALNTPIAVSSPAGPARAQHRSNSQAEPPMPHPLLVTRSGLMDPVAPDSFFASTPSSSSTFVPKAPRVKIPVRRTSARSRTDDDGIVEFDEFDTPAAGRIQPVMVGLQSKAGRVRDTHIWEPSSSQRVGSSSLYPTSSTRGGPSTLHMSDADQTRALQKEQWSDYTSGQFRGVLQRSSSSSSLSSLRGTESFRPQVQLGRITPNLLSLKDELIPGAAGGIWPTSVWDFTINAPESAKFPPPGGYLHIPPPEAPVDTVMSNTEEVAPPGPTPTPVPTRAWGIIPTVTAGEAPAVPSALPAIVTVDNVRLAHRTATTEELGKIRPHPNAYYSRTTSTWAIMTQYKPQEVIYVADLSPTRPHMWRPAAKTIKASKLNVAASIPPYSTEHSVQFSSVDKFGLYLDELTELQSSRGGVTSIVHSPLDFIPTVINKALVDAFNHARGANPLPNEDAMTAQLTSWNFLWKALDDLMIKGEMRKLPLGGSGFKKRMPWDAISQHIYLQILGFTEKDMLLTAPNVDDSTEAGRINRARCLRCWLEVGLYLADHRARGLQSDSVKSSVARYNLIGTRPQFLEMLGGDNLPRIILPKNESPSPIPYDGLGVTGNLSDLVIIDAYEDQHHFSPPDLRPALLDHLEAIGKERDSADIGVHMVMCRSKGRWTERDLSNAYTKLGFSRYNPLDSSSGLGDPRFETEDEVEHRFTSAMEKATAVQDKRDIKDALDLIARARPSEFLSVIVSSTEIGSEPTMTVQGAWDILKLPAGTDEEFVLATCVAALEDSPAQVTLYYEALAKIADSTGSARLRQYLAQARGESDSGWAVVSPNDRPIGLTNIANTCYLNSLLQYFFTVRELREAILRFPPGAGDRPVENADEIRVGGRLVTEVEVLRSKRFVLLLQDLYNRLIHVRTSSVTPETELAYLALVPSKDEEEIKAKNALDLMVPDDDDDEVQIISSSKMDISPAPPRSTTPESLKSPISVLGKRGSDQLDQVTDAQAVKSPLRTQDVNLDLVMSEIPHRALTLPGPLISSKPSSASSPTLPSPTYDENTPLLSKRASTLDSSASTILDPLSEEMDQLVDSDVEMRQVTPAAVAPPLPPRNAKGKGKATVTPDLETKVSSYMAFGKQNDVTECMDNVMFQIECAFMPRHGVTDENSSLVKQLFYGKMRQRLELQDASSAEPVRTKEEPFSYLLVDVAEEGRHLYDGLDTVFDSALVTIDGQQAQRRISLVDVPPILQIQLQRVQYDRVENKVFKSNAHLSFGDTLAMDRYLQVEDGDLEGIERRDKTSQLRRELEEARGRLAQLVNVKPYTPDVLGDLVTWLSNDQSDLAEVIDEGLVKQTEQEIHELSSEIDGLRLAVHNLRESIEEIWKDQQKAAFELVAVFMHRGTAQSGHYFIYQRNSKQPSQWLKYNDSLITDIDPAEHVFAPSGGDTNPYFLVWVRKDRLDSIESICRDA